MVVTADAQITQIEVLVERAPMAAALSGDVTGRVPLKVKMGAQVGNKVRVERCFVGRTRCAIIGHYTHLHLTHKIFPLNVYSVMSSNITSLWA